MTNLNLNDLVPLKELMELKRQKPEEYKQFLQDMKEIMLDLMQIAKEISEETE